MNDTRTQRERMLAGDLYIADDPQLARESRRAAELYGAYNASSPDDPEARRRILVDLLGSFGEDSEIRPPFYCDYGYQTFVGARTFMNFGCVGVSSCTSGPICTSSPISMRATSSATQPKFMNVRAPTNVW